jgi:hypothetical protein
MIEPSSRVRRAPHVLWRSLGDGALLTTPGDVEFVHLSVTAAAVWERLDGTRPLSEVLDALAEMFDAPRSTLLEDVSSLLNGFAQRRWIETLPDG